MSESEVRSDGLSDEDEDVLDTPSSPPVKPLSLLNYYIEQNRSRIIEENGFSVQEANSRLKQIFKEELGKEEKQKWTRKHKLLKKKFDKLLQLYKDANPTFNSDNYYDSQKQNNNNNNRNNKNNKNQNKKNRNNNNKNYGIGYQKKFVMEDFSSNNNKNNKNKENRKRKRSGKNNKSSNSIDGIESLMNEPMKSKRRKKNEIVLDKKEIDKMKLFVEKMKLAARQDWESNLKKEPTLNCYRLLQSVINELNKKLLHHYFLDECRILDGIRDWIHPLPDGSLPTIKIREEMYRILLSMEIHKEEDCHNYLMASEERSQDIEYLNIKYLNNKYNINFKLKGLCKTLMNLWSSKDETHNNKQLLRNILDKLIRKLTPQRNVSYAELREENTLENKEQYNEIMLRNKIDKKRRKLLNERNANITNNKRAKIPQKPSFDFIFNPTSNIDADTKHDKLNKNNKITKYSNVEAKFKRLKSTQTKNQAYKPSVTGKRY